MCFFVTPHLSHVCSEDLSFADAQKLAVRILTKVIAV